MLLGYGSPKRACGIDQNREIADMVFDQVACRSHVKGATVGQQANRIRPIHEPFAERPFEVVQTTHAFEWEALQLKGLHDGVFRYSQ